MKNTPSNRASLLIAAWYRCSSSGPANPVMFVLTSSTMPARGDHYWRKSDSHPQGRLLAAPAEIKGAVGGIIGDIMRGQ